jgi:hypothetical protein
MVSSVDSQKAALETKSKNSSIKRKKPVLSTDTKTVNKPPLKRMKSESSGLESKGPVSLELKNAQQRNQSQSQNQNQNHQHPHHQLPKKRGLSLDDADSDVSTEDFTKLDSDDDSLDSSYDNQIIRDPKEIARYYSPEEWGKAAQMFAGALVRVWRFDNPFPC